ncbi:MAG: hypothetical protein SNG10_03845 [Rikenellaceae bacterium]
MNKLYIKITTATLGLLLCVGLDSASAEELATVTTTESVTIYERIDEIEEVSNLQRVGCVVPISFVVHVPANEFTFDNARVYTPVLVNGKWRKELPQMIVKGRSYKIVTADEVTFKEDDVDTTQYYLAYTKPMFKSIDAPYETEVKFEPEMRGAKLILELEDKDYNRGIKQGKAWWKKQTGELEDIEVVQYGVVDFSHLELYDQTLFVFEDKILEEDFDNKSVFKINSAAVQKDAFSSKFKALVNSVDNLIAEDARVKSVSVAVSASLDGPYEKNAKLAIAREDAMKEMIADQFTEVEPCLISYSNVAENWDDFVAEAKNRGFYRDIRDIVESSYDKDEKEKMLRSSDYRREVIEVCIENRNCLITVVYTIPAPYVNKAGFKVCCMRNSAANPGKVQGKGDQYELNNEMVALMKRGEYVKAFEISKKITLDRAEVINNKAVLLSFLGDYPMAKYYFAKTEDLECHDYNVALMYMLADDTESAVKMFGDSNCHNAIVANIAMGEYDRAIELTLESGYEDAKAIYLRAIAYSYTQEADLTLFTLRQACNLDPTYKKMAKCQVEFMPLRDMAAYEDIVK